MENQPLPSPLVAALFFLANTITATASSLLTQVFLRRKQTSDISRTDALNRKTEAEARAIDSRIINEAHAQLAEFAERLQNADLQRRWDTREIADLKWKIGVNQTLIKAQEEQIRLAHAELLTLRKPRQLLPGDKIV